MDEIAIVAPSYRRASRCRVHAYLPTVRYVVSESEAPEYVKAVGSERIWVCPDAVQGNVSRVRNWILDNAGPAVLMVDDDLSSMGMWDGTRRRKVGPDEAMAFIGNGFSMCEDGDIRFWGLSPLNTDKRSYRDFAPFSMTSFLGGPFQGHWMNDCRYDERLSLKEDYDMTIQVLNRYRRVLRFNYWHYNNDFHSIPGGCAAYRTMEREREQFKLLQSKWGSRIVGIDRETAKRGGVNIDPIIRVPIPGI